MAVGIPNAMATIIVWVQGRQPDDLCIGILDGSAVTNIPENTYTEHDAIFVTKSDKTSQGDLHKILPHTKFLIATSFVEAELELSMRQLKVYLEHRSSVARDKANGSLEQKSLVRLEVFRVPSLLW